jgi:hypothetical protein
MVRAVPGLGDNGNDHSGRARHGEKRRWRRIEKTIQTTEV